MDTVQFILRKSLQYLQKYEQIQKMGIQSSHNAKIKQRHQNFLKVFKNNYKLSEEINDEIFGNAFLYQNINTNAVEVLEKSITYNTQSQIQKVVKTMQMRIRYPHPNLIRVYSTQYMDDRQLCGGNQTVKIYTQYLQRTLRGEVNKRRKIGSFLSQQLLLKITASLLNGLNYLHEEKTFHGEIRSQTILVDGTYHLKLVERALLCPTNWQIVKIQGSNFKVLKGKGVLLSPCILDCLKQKTTQMSGYDPFKADIFALGMILLQCCSLKKAQQFYDYEQLSVKEDEISMTIYQCRRKYSHKLMNIVEKMVEVQDESRPDVKKLLDQIQVISGQTLRQLNTTLNQSFLSETIRSYM